MTWVFLVWLGLVAAVVAAGPVQLRRAGFRASVPVPVLEHPHRFRAAARFTGGCRIGWLNATVPNAKLTFDEQYARIKVRAPLGSSDRFRQVWVPREQVVRVQVLRWFPARGLRFVTRDGRYDAVVFFSFTPGKVAARMAAEGWPTGRGDAQP